MTICDFGNMTRRVEFACSDCLSFKRDLRKLRQESQRHITVQQTKVKKQQEYIEKLEQKLSEKYSTPVISVKTEYFEPQHQIENRENQPSSSTIVTKKERDNDQIRLLQQQIESLKEKTSADAELIRSQNEKLQQQDTLLKMKKERDQSREYKRKFEDLEIRYGETLKILGDVQEKNAFLKRELRRGTDDVIIEYERVSKRQRRNSNPSLPV